jgi:dolichyl-phosphate-mannose--protein O-mannosyl transferase
VADHQIAMLRFHVGLEGHHPYESAPWSWLLLQRPVAYSFAVEGDRYREVLAIGNPLTWWAGTVVLAGLAVNWARTGAGWVRAEPILVIGALATYLPWLILSGARSQVFIWYILPTIPFLCAALGLVAARAWGSGAGKVAVSVAGVAVLAWVTFFYPVLTAQPLRPDEWLARMWLTDCQRPGAPSLELPDDEISSGPPPSGWCWI